jgi:hypothetical protein
MGSDEQTNANTKQNKQTENKQIKKIQVQEQWNFNLSFSSGVTPSVSSPGVGI